MCLDKLKKFPEPLFWMGSGMFQGKLTFHLVDSKNSEWEQSIQIG